MVLFIFTPGSRPAWADDPPAPKPPPATPSPTDPAAPTTAPPTAPVPQDSPARLLPPDKPYPPLVEKGPLRTPIIWPGRRFSTADWIVTGAATGTAIAAAFVPPRANHWTGGILFDEGARNVFRLGSQQARFIARDASDVILSLEATWPFFVDALISAWWYHGSPDAAAEMALIDTQALAIVFAVQGATNYVSSRERPYGRDCGTSLPSNINECSTDRYRYRSFFSGHAAISFMSAGLICVHHLKLGLFGNQTADTMSCVVAYAGAATTAMLRTMGDVHYTTDILIGSVVGTLIGVGIPLLHYRKPSDARLLERGAGVNVTLIPVGLGLGLAGTF
jgi:membrane-associated phospholipid phosphatase